MNAGNIALTWLVVTAFSASATQAQPGSRKPTPPPAAGASDLKTIVEVDVIIPRAGAGAEVQEWGRFFNSIGISAQLRQGTSNEKPSTTDKVMGTLRTVQVVGRLDPRGQVYFADRSFSAADKEKFKEWLDELKVYGAQGAPQGKPLWGLNKEQFDVVHAALSVPTQGEYIGKTIPEILLGDDWKFANPIRLHSSAEAIRETGATCRTSTFGLTRGTGLANVLSDFGLGFRPQRMPNGQIELVVLPIKDLKDPWPVGWPLAPDKPRNEIAPSYFRSGPVDFENQPLSVVLGAIAQRTEVPILIDYVRCAAKKVNVDSAKVSHPKKSIAYALVVNTVVHQVKLIAQLRVDEADRPFVVVMPFEPRVLEGEQGVER
jgi:hypothetical protein